MKSILMVFFMFFLGNMTLQGQVVINEYSAANLNVFKDNYGKTEDWIELYNTSGATMDISGYHLSDKSSKPGKWTIPEGTLIPGNGFIVFWCSGRDEHFQNNYHTNFKLSQTKGNETIVFSDPDENVIEQTAVKQIFVEQSVCKNVDGGDQWMICTTPTLGTSNDGSEQYTGFTHQPSIEEEAGFYKDSVIVKIDNLESNSVLRYTLDGSNPTPDSPEYSGSLTIKKTTVVKAKSFSNDPLILPGKMVFSTFFINEDFTLPVFSVAADEVLDLANGDGDVIPVGSIEYFNTSKEREAISFGSLNRHGQDSWVLPHRSLDWVSRDEMGYSKAVKAKLFAYSKRKSYQKFMFRNSGDDNYPAINDQDHKGSTHIRDEYVQTLAQNGGLKLDRRAVRRVILFLNGDYWGVYGLRERPVDADYTKEYYDQDKYHTQFLTTWATTKAQYGGARAFNDWYRLRDFILENDMGDTTNYEKVKDQLNLVSLVDYMAVNLNCVASDWLNYNTGWWRGIDPEGDHKKWGFILWDLDATFDYYINYSGVPNTGTDAKQCDIEHIGDFVSGFLGQKAYGAARAGGGHPIDVSGCATISDGSSPYESTDSVFAKVVYQDEYCCNNEWDRSCQELYNEISFPFSVIDEVEGNVGKHEAILLKLIDESPEFRQLWYSRHADLMNTVFSCDNMINTLDSMVAIIEPEMPQQIQRWGGSMGEWNQNVQKLKNFIMSRCEKLDDGLVDCYDLTGPFDVTLKVRPEGVGSIDFNTIKDIKDFPWKGNYFGGMLNKLKANAIDPGYQFSHWESKSGYAITPSPFEHKAFIEIDGNDEITAVFSVNTGVENIEKDLGLKVYPNPSEGDINVGFSLDKSQYLRWKITSIEGRYIAGQGQGIWYSSGKHGFVISPSQYGIMQGMYLLTLMGEDFEVTRKISILP